MILIGVGDIENLNPQRNLILANTTKGRVVREVHRPIMARFDVQESSSLNPRKSLRRNFYRFITARFVENDPRTPQRDNNFRNSDAVEERRENGICTRGKDQEGQGESSGECHQGPPSRRRDAPCASFFI